MNSSSVSAQALPGVLDKLNKASSAEDFFALLGVDHDPKILSVARLHILIPVP
jgi:nitrogenase-stabilizing/protective protein